MQPVKGSHDFRRRIFSPRRAPPRLIVDDTAVAYFTTPRQLLYWLLERIALTTAQVAAARTASSQSMPSQSRRVSSWASKAISQLLPP